MGLSWGGTCARCRRLMSAFGCTDSESDRSRIGDRLRPPPLGGLAQDSIVFSGARSLPVARSPKPERGPHARGAPAADLENDDVASVKTASPTRNGCSDADPRWHGGLIQADLEESASRLGTPPRAEDACYTSGPALWRYESDAERRRVAADRFAQPSFVKVSILLQALASARAAPRPWLRAAEAGLARPAKAACRLAALG